MSLREKLAEIEHEQWLRWAKAILPELQELTKHHLPYGDEREAGRCACKTCQRIKRWEQECFKPYSELTEQQKDTDRQETRPVLALIHSEIEGAGLDPKQPKDVHIANYRMGKEAQQAHILKILEVK